MTVEHFFLCYEKKKNMKNIVDQFRGLLKSDCLNKTEKTYLSAYFRNFIQKREIISRKSLEYKKEEEAISEWAQNNIG